MNPAAGAIAPAPGDRLAAEPRLVGRPTVRLIGPIAVLSLASAVGTAGAPWLRGTPLLLMALAPRLPFLAFAGAAGLRVAVVVILDLAGTVLYLACLHAGSSVLR